MAKTTKKTAKKSRDPQEESMKAFEQGLDLLYKKKWAAADKIFAGIVAQQPGTTQAERARRFRDVCANRLADSDDSGDSYLNAVYLKNTGDFEAAMEYCNRGGLKGRDERYAYLAASLQVLQENFDEGAKHLIRAIELNPANRVHAAHDSDFIGLRSDPDFAEIFDID